MSFTNEIPDAESVQLLLQLARSGEAMGPRELAKEALGKGTPRREANSRLYKMLKHDLLSKHAQADGTKPLWSITDTGRALLAQVADIPEMPTPSSVPQPYVQASAYPPPTSQQTAQEVTAASDTQVALANPMSEPTVPDIALLTTTE